MLGIILPVLQGCCTIQIYKKTDGVNWHPHTITWEVWGNTLISADWFPALNRERWVLLEVDKKNGKFFHAKRAVYVNRKPIHIMMAREILGLPRKPGMRGDQADHRNHDTLDNTLENLRVATPMQNSRNTGKKGIACRFKGVSKNKRGFSSQLRYEGMKLYLGTFKIDVEAALVYFYAGALLHGEYFHGSEIPQDEMPSAERQEELWRLVLAKLRSVGFLAGI